MGQLPVSTKAAHGIQNLNGGKTFPKAGRLATGAYFRGTDQGNSDQIRGNAFGPNAEALAQRRTTTGPRNFGSRSNAGNGTSPFDSRLTLGQDSTHPNSGFHMISKQNYVMPISSNTGGRVESPFGVNPVVQPHERNMLHAKKARTTHHASSGGGNSVLPTDTAFQRRPPQQIPRNPRVPQQQVLRVQFEANGLPKSSGPAFSHESSGTFVPSFTSRNQLWTDPNQSFLKGQHNPIANATGAGRWQVVKRGAAG